VSLYFFYKSIFIFLVERALKIAILDDLATAEKELNLVLMLFGVKKIMQELKFRNFMPSLFAFIAAVIISGGVSCINISPFGLPAPLLIIGLFAGYLILVFLSYPKATTAQVIQLSMTGVFLNITVLAATVYAIKYFNLSNVALNSEFIISINPLTPPLSFLFSYITLISFVKFEDKVIETKKTHAQKEKQAENKVEDIQPETISFENFKILKSVEENTEILNKNKEAIEEKPKSLYEEIYPQAKNETESIQEPQEQEFFFGLNEDEPQNKTEITEEKPLNLSDEFIQLESFPSIQINESFKENKTNINPPQQEKEEYFDFIPTDIRLVEAPVSKENKSKGKIAAIGKLLVNNRDIEGVIESGAAVAEGSNEGKTNVFSSVSGEQIYEKFNKLKLEFAHIREIALIDKGGFILASNYEDKMKIHITGALIAGAYHTLQNYLAQISFNHPQRIFFKTENSNNFIMKTNNEFLFSIWDKDFKHVDYSVLQGFLESETILDADLTPLVELNQIKSYAISNSAGQLVKSADNTENSENLAIISSALFENLKVFLMNIQLLKLSGITVFNSEEVITIQKFNDEIAAFITPLDGLVKISDDLLKMEEIY